MTIIRVKLNQKKAQKNPEKTKKIEEEIQANINFISWKEIYLVTFFLPSTLSLNNPCLQIECFDLI